MVSPTIRLSRPLFKPIKLPPQIRAKIHAKDFGYSDLNNSYLLIDYIIEDRKSFIDIV